MAEKQDGSDVRLNHFNNFFKIARELREFEAYETISDLLHRMLCYKHPDGNAETAEDVYKKGIRITFIGNSSASEKRKFIEAAFPKAAPLQVGQVGNSPGIESYSYREKPKDPRFVFFNTPSLSEWSDVNKITDTGKWHTEAVVFFISGDRIDETEKSCLNKIKYQVDSDFIFFVHAVENSTPVDNVNNLDIISDILSSDILSVKPEEIRYFSSSESSSIAEDFAAKAWIDLLFRKTRSYMVQNYKQFEIKAEAYLRSHQELSKFRDDLNRVENQAIEAVDRVTKKFNRRIDQVFPIEASYSPDIRGVIKDYNQRLSKREIKGELEASRLLDANTKEVLKKWSIVLEDIIAEYLRDISYEVSEKIESGHSYRSPIPLNRKIELQAMSDFSLHLFKINTLANIVRTLPSGIFPAYFGYGLVTKIMEATAPATIAAIIIGGAVIAALLWYNSEEKKRQESQVMVSEGEKDMKPFNYYVAHTIRMEFEEIVHFSQDAVQNIFKEIRKAERKRITINNPYPTIKALTEDSLLVEKIHRNLEAIESVSL
jgi:hypothetical protein